MALSGFDKRLTQLFSLRLIMIRWCINPMKIEKEGVEMADGASFLEILSVSA